MITQELLHELFDYDATTGNLLWRIKDKFNQLNDGQIAGSPHIRGYQQIKIDGSSYKAHRLIWIYNYGINPPEMVDHIDGDPKNNKLGNLRLADRSENGYNRKLNKNSKSGVKGVSLETKTGRWRVDISINKKQRHFGSYPTLEQAEKVARETRERLHGEFHNHGDTI